MARSIIDIVVAAALIIIGVLMCIGRLGLGPVLPYLGVILIVVGVLILMGVLPSSKLIGVAALVIGILLAINFLHLPADVQKYMWIANLVAGIILIVLGAQKLLKG